ncbi:hypothetical protein [Diaphorobacter ruginosibacter]|uniref:hypothetical protein n=1 Tax=Diaphorobacter ruginosibacter TaxID=1715720 RepID=UPI00333F670E
MRITSVLLSICVATAAWSGIPMAHAASKSASKSADKKSSAVRIKHTKNNSEESQAERDRRLYRECRGLPNAGACAGYTQK